MEKQVIQKAKYKDKEKGYFVEPYEVKDGIVYFDKIMFDKIEKREHYALLICYMPIKKFLEKYKFVGNPL